MVVEMYCLLVKLIVNSNEVFTVRYSCYRIYICKLYSCYHCIQMIFFNNLRINHFVINSACTKHVMLVKSQGLVAINALTSSICSKHFLYLK